MKESLPKIDDLSSAILVTHAGCMDGAGSVIAFIKSGGRRKNVKFVSPGNTGHVLWSVKANGSDRPMIFADVAPRLPDEIEHYTRMGNVVVLDHHKTSETLRDVSWCEIDLTRCGSKLLFEYLGGLSNVDLIMYEQLFDMIDDHDRWQNRSNVSDELSIFMKIVGFERFVDRFLVDPSVTWNQSERFAIEASIERRNGYVEKIARDPFICDVDGKSVAYVIASEHVSYLLHDVLKRHANVDIAAAIDFSNNVVSLRSDDPKHDCSDFAARRGGGGHACSAAYKIDRRQVEELVEDLSS